VPTGYTSYIKEGVTFEQFALRCARAFGACIEMRDEDMGKNIPDEFKPSIYHEEALAEAKKSLEAVIKMTEKEAAIKAKKRYDENIADTARAIKEHKELRKLYEAMLEQVRAWVPPTKEHKGMKKFMIEQIESSIEHDCDTKYYEDRKFVLLTGAQYKTEEIKSLQDSIAYNTKEDMAEKERARDRTEWVRKLRKSLKRT